MTRAHRSTRSLLAGPGDGDAALFHENTKLWAGVEAHKPRGAVSQRERDAVFTDRAVAGQGAAVEEAAALEPPAAPSVPPAVQDLFRRRRTARGFAPGSTDGALLTQLLEVAHRVTGTLPLPGGSLPLRTAPSAGGLFPVRLDIAAWAVDGWEQGPHRYDPLTREVAARPAPPDFRGRWRSACGSAPRSRHASATLVLSADLARATEKYGDRGYRYALLEAGHIAQNLSLLAPALGLAVQPQGAFYDDSVARLIGVDGVTTCPVHLLHAGIPLIPHTANGDSDDDSDDHGTVAPRAGGRGAGGRRPRPDRG